MPLPRVSRTFTRKCIEADEAGCKERAEFIPDCDVNPILMPDSPDAENFEESTALLDRRPLPS